MTDHAATVREALEYAKQVWDNTDDDRYCDTALAALAALEQERDEAQEALQALAQDHYFARAEAAEAERDKFKGVVVLIASKKCLNGNSTCDWPCVVCIARAALAGEDAP